MYVFHLASCIFLLSRVLDSRPQVVDAASLDLKNSRCGISNLKTTGVESEVGDSSPGDFPWHASIFQKRNDSWEMLGGGVLVSPKTVLTAAHSVTTRCVSNCKPEALDTREIMVVLGKVKRDWKLSEDFEIRTGVTEIKVHPYYRGAAQMYSADIAMLKLDQEIVPNRFVMPACLDLNNDIAGFDSGKPIKGYVTGFGSTEECSSLGQVCNPTRETLKYVKTTVTNYNDCFDLYSQKKPNSPFRLSTDKFCAGNGTVSPVQPGDSGVGVTVIHDGLHYVLGVASSKLKLDVGDKLLYSLATFSNFSSFSKWLKGQL